VADDCVSGLQRQAIKSKIAAHRHVANSQSPIPLNLKSPNRESRTLYPHVANREVRTCDHVGCQRSSRIAVPQPQVANRKSQSARRNRESRSPRSPAANRASSIHTVVSLESEIGKRSSQIPNPKSEIANRQLPIANRKSQIANRKSQIANRKSQMAND